MPSGPGRGPGPETSIARSGERGKGFEELAPEGGNGFEKPHPRGGKGFEKVVRKESLRFENLLWFGASRSDVAPDSRLTGRGT